MMSVIEKLYFKKKIDIKKYYLIEKLIKFLIYIIESPIYLLILPAILIIYALRPVVLIRWRSLYERRIGPFAAMNENYLCEKKSGINIPKKKYIDIFYFETKACNAQLAKMWKRKLNVQPAFFMKRISKLNKFLGYLFSINNKVHEIQTPSTERDAQRDVHLLWGKTPPSLNFTQKEITKGRKILNEFGLSDNEKFVCLFARDSAYLDQHQIPPKGSWNYHAYRDYDINNFIPAAEEMVKRGYYVFRVGKVANKKLNTSNPKIIDYAFSNLKSDFMDIYLAANCSFFFSTMAGIDQVPSIFRRPLAAIVVPIGMMQTNRSNIISIFKHHVEKNTKQKLSLSEIFSKGLAFATSSDDYKKQNLELVENTAEEIKDLAIEMMDTIENKKKESKTDLENQETFWKLYQRNLFMIKDNRSHGIELKGKIGAEFLNSNKNYLV